MKTVYIFHAADEAGVSAQIAQELRHACIADAVTMYDTSALNFAEMDDSSVLAAAARTDCVVLIWSAAMARSPRAALAVRATINAWSVDRSTIGIVDDMPRPPGLRDLAVRELKIDQSTKPAASIATRESIQSFVLFVRSRIAATRELLFSISSHRIAPVRPLAMARLERQTFSPAGELGDRGLFGLVDVLPTAPKAFLRSALNAGGFIAIGLGVITWVMRASLPKYPAVISSSSILDNDATNTPDRSFAFDLIEAGLFFTIASLALFLVVRWMRTRKALHEYIMLLTTLLRDKEPMVGSPGRQATDRTSFVPVTKGTLSAPAETMQDHDVFISYSRQDATRVGAVVKQIEAAGYSVWIDTSETAGAQRYAGQIVRAIRSSKVVALMCSQHAFQSDHVVREVYVAGDEKKAFVAVQLDDTVFPDDLVYFLSGFPRLAAAQLSQERLRTEIARFVVA